MEKLIDAQSEKIREKNRKSTKNSSLATDLLRNIILNKLLSGETTTWTIRCESFPLVRGGTRVFTHLSYIILFMNGERLSRSVRAFVLFHVVLTHFELEKNPKKNLCFFQERHLYVFVFVCFLLFVLEIRPRLRHLLSLACEVVNDT